MVRELTQKVNLAGDVSCGDLKKEKERTRHRISLGCEGGWGGRAARHLVQVRHKVVGGRGGALHPMPR